MNNNDNKNEDIPSVPKLKLTKEQGEYMRTRLYPEDLYRYHVSTLGEKVLPWYLRKMQEQVWLTPPSYIPLYMEVAEELGYDMEKVRAYKTAEWPTDLEQEPINYIVEREEQTCSK